MMEAVRWQHVPYMRSHRSFVRLWIATAALALAALTPSSLAAQSSPCPRCSVADASDALPGFGVSAMPQLQRAVSASFVGSGSYGLNVDPLGSGSLHHRLAGTIAGAVHIVPWLAIGLRMNGRYDLVSAGGRSDDGLFGYPAASLRLSAEPVAGFTLGLDAQAMVFGAEAPSFELESTSVLLRALAAYAADLGGGARFVVAINLGYFLDNSRNAAPRGVTDNLSPEDRLSLGVSDAGAFVASLGGAYVTDGLDLYAEVSARIYTDDDVIGSSPIRVGAGARFWLAPEVLFLGIGADVRVTPQSSGLFAPGTMANAPVEPALTAQLSLGVRLGAETPPGEVVVDDTQDTEDETDTHEDEIVAPTVGTAAGHVTDEQGPVASATIELTSDVDGATHTATADADGRWQIPSLPIGGAHYRVTAEGHDVFEGTLEVTAGPSAEVGATMARSLPQGELRGVIQASNGRPLAARIVIRPIGRELTADAEGSFAIEVPPGEYDVVVSAPGHREQTRHVSVSEQGVVVLNVQLRPSR